jgi:hypothetical protein
MTTHRPQSLSQIADARRRELRRLSQKLQKAEISAKRTKDEIALRLYAWHEDGMSVTDLALAAGISRETAYRMLERYRAELAAQQEGR